jgi:hypothetical protein
MKPALIVAALVAALIGYAPPARAGLCEYPGVGAGGGAFGINGGFCDFPEEVNGTHWHCEEGGLNLGGGFGGPGGQGNVAFGLGGGGLSCTWRCPDNTLGPAPNPPGLWKTFLVAVPNACKDHMDPAGFYTEPVRPDEGGPVIPPAGPPPPQPAPPDGGGVPPGVGPNIANQTAPGEPNP